MPESPEIAYFTMEIALEDAIPTFSGGLGVLAGDYLRSAADGALPLVAVTLLYRGGYFRQEVDEAGEQTETPVEWEPGELLEALEETVTVEVDGRPVTLGAWRYDLQGITGAVVPVYFLDADREENDSKARQLTDRLYSGDKAHRLRQEVLLGLGGVELLRRLGHAPGKYHMNEGHSALLVLRLLEEEEAAAVRERCVFTTHTPVPAGHDRFELPLVRQVLGEERTGQLRALGCLETGELNMTELGIAGSGYVNAVSRRHGEVTAEMFPGVEVTSVTNGVHVGTWAGPSFALLYDRHLSGWRERNELLRYASCIPIVEIEQAHREEKQRLLDQVVDRSGRHLDASALTIGVARRATPYKRTTLILSDTERLVSMAKETGPIQIIFAGKAHPDDRGGKELLEEIVGESARLAGELQVVFLEDYDLRLASLLVAGCDIWLNTPEKPNEASGTSGMKAAVNGVPSLSVLDGWWIEGCLDGLTGWAIGSLDEGDDAESLYDRLERRVLPSFYGSPNGLGELRRAAISINGSFFNTERMAREYARFAYGLAPGQPSLRQP